MPVQLRFVSPITVQPIDVNANVGSQISFFVGVADPNDVITYQWQVSTDQGITYSNIPGEDGSTLILIASNDIHNNRYRAIVYFKQPNPNSVHLASSDAEVNKIYTDAGIFSIIGYVYPSSLDNIEYIIP